MVEEEEEAGIVVEGAEAVEAELPEETTTQEGQTPNRKDSVLPLEIMYSIMVRRDQQIK